MNTKPTLDDVQSTIDRYVFEIDTPIVLAITGGWGEGKTFFWRNHIVPKHAERRPGYVSVFGAESVSSIRERVLVAASEAIDVREKSISDLVKDRYPWVRQIGHALTGIGKFWSGAIGVPESVIDQLMESTLLQDGWTVCIDDVERLSDKIGTDTFLGYVNELREEHRLNVVLIFNQDWFEGKKDQAFERYREKVIDREVPFVPDLNDIIQLVASDEDLTSDEAQKLLVDRCEVLGLRNIRVLGKAFRYFGEVKSKLPADADSAFTDAALYSLLLFTWIRFGPERTIQFGDLETYSVLGRSMARHARASIGEEDDEEDLVEKLLSEYGYTFTDDLDLILIDFVQNGILNEEALLEEFEKYQNKSSRGLLERRFREVWKEYFHGTLIDNSEEFSAALVEATRPYLPHATVEQMSSNLHILEKLGHENEAKVLFDEFIASRPNFLREYEEMASFSEPIRYEPMQAAIDHARETEKKDDRSLAQVLQDTWDEEFLSQANREKLAQFTGPEIADCLLNSAADRITSRIRNLYKITLPTNSEEDQSIRSALDEAIEIIADKSTINRLRMEAMGLITRQS